MFSRIALSIRTRADAVATIGATERNSTHEDALDWSWPPYAPVESSGVRFDTPEWAPSSLVEHPLLRVGRWTLLYRRGA